jgi:hypothetical protein
MCRCLDRVQTMTYIVKVNVSNNWFIRCSTKDLKLANQQADKMREQGFKVKFIREQTND